MAVCFAPVIAAIEPDEISPLRANSADAEKSKLCFAAVCGSPPRGACAQTCAVSVRLDGAAVVLCFQVFVENRKGRQRHFFARCSF